MKPKDTMTGKGKGAKSGKAGGIAAGRHVGLMLSKNMAPATILGGLVESDGSVDEESKSNAQREACAAQIADTFACSTHGGRYCYVSSPTNSHPGAHLQMNFMFMQHLAKYMVLYLLFTSEFC